MKIEIRLSLGFSVVVDEDGTFELPSRPFTTTELKKVVKEVNRALRYAMTENKLDEVLYEE